MGLGEPLYVVNRVKTILCGFLAAERQIEKTQFIRYQRRSEYSGLVL